MTGATPIASAVIPTPTATRAAAANRLPPMFCPPDYPAVFANYNESRNSIVQTPRSPEGDNRLPAKGRLGVIADIGCGSALMPSVVADFVGQQSESQQSRAQRHQK